MASNDSREIWNGTITAKHCFANGFLVIPGPEDVNSESILSPLTFCKFGPAERGNPRVVSYPPPVSYEPPRPRVTQISSGMRISDLSIY